MSHCCFLKNITPCKYCCTEGNTIQFLQDIKKLKWQCRRGTQELDRLLMGYLEREYLNATLAEQQDFQRLLNLQDNELLQLFFTETDLDLRGLNHLIEKIRYSAIIYPS